MRLIIYMISFLAVCMTSMTAMAQETSTGGGTANAVAKPGDAKGEPEKPEVAQNVHVHMIAIYATKKGEDGGKIDPSLESLRGKLERGFEGYGNFTPVGENQLTIDLGKSASASLPNGSNVSISYLGGEGRFAKLKFEIPEKLSTKLKVARGNTFFQAGLSYKDGILIIAIEVK